METGFNRNVLRQVFAGSVVVASGATMAVESSFAGETLPVFAGLVVVYTGLRVSEGLEIPETVNWKEFLGKRSMGLLAGMLAVAKGLSRAASLESSAALPFLQSAALIFGGFVIVHLSYESDKL